MAAALHKLCRRNSRPSCYDATGQFMMMLRRHTGRVKAVHESTMNEHLHDSGLSSTFIVSLAEIESRRYSRKLTSVMRGMSSRAIDELAA